MSERVGMSKKLRFEVFKRDLFTCQYCGAHPSETVLLEVDHINPVAAGGGNEIDNLVTACFDCNRGKSDRLLTAIPQSLADKASEVQEREAQIRAYYEILQAKKDRKDEEIWSIADVLMERYGDDNRDAQGTCVCWPTGYAGYVFFAGRDFHRLKHFEIISKAPAFSYFCGICWRKIKRANGEEV